MKNMTRERFMQNDITCAVAIQVRNGTRYMYEALYGNKSGFCFGIKLRKHPDIVKLIKSNAKNEEGGAYRAPKHEITEELNPADGRYVNMFDHYTAALEMTVEEFDTILNILQDGHYIIALTDVQ